MGEEDGGLGASKMAGNKEPIGGRTFKEWYLDKFTDAFADDLDKIRVQVRVCTSDRRYGTLIKDLFGFIVTDRDHARGTR